MTSQSCSINCVRHCAIWGGYDCVGGGHEKQGEGGGCQGWGKEMGCIENMFDVGETRRDLLVIIRHLIAAAIDGSPGLPLQIFVNIIMSQTQYSCTGAGFIVSVCSHTKTNSSPGMIVFGRGQSTQKCRYLDLHGSSNQRVSVMLGTQSSDSDEMQHHILEHNTSSSSSTNSDSQ